MISIIYGPKGTGKTKVILDEINDKAKKAKGNIVFIAKERGYSVDIDFSVKVAYASEYYINNVDKLDGFIKGMLAGNNDIEYVFIDGISRITNSNLQQMESIFADLENISKANSINFVITISATLEQIPAFIKKYIK